MSSNSFPFIRTRRPSRTPRLIIIAILVLIIGAVWVFQAPLRSLFWHILTPVLVVRNTLSASDTGALRAEVATLKARLLDRDALYQENLALKALFNRAAGRTVTVAGILQRPPATPYDTFMIDAGEDEGILVGSRVSLGGSALVGVVSEVYATISRVTLYSAPGEVHSGIVLVDGASIPLSIEGQGGGSMRSQVPAGTNAAVGDVVILPEVGMGLTAVVSHVEQGSSESFETVYFSLPADLNARFVEIWQ